MFGGLWSSSTASEDQSTSGSSSNAAAANSARLESDATVSTSENVGTNGWQSDGADQRRNPLDEEKQRGLAHRARLSTSSMQLPVPPLILVANKMDLADGAASAQQSLPVEVTLGWCHLSSQPESCHHEEFNAALPREG